MRAREEKEGLLPRVVLNNAINVIEFYSATSEKDSFQTILNYIQAGKDIFFRQNSNMTRINKSLEKKSLTPFYLSALHVHFEFTLRIELWHHVLPASASLIECFISTSTRWRPMWYQSSVMSKDIKRIHCGYVFYIRALSSSFNYVLCDVENSSGIYSGKFTNL